VANKKQKPKKICKMCIVVGILIVGVIIGIYFMFLYNPYKFRGDGPIKILILNSYHEGFDLTDLQVQGFIERFGKYGMEFEIKSFYMDTKRNDKEEWPKRAEGAKNLIDSWRPDLVYTTDDDVQKYVVMDYLDTDIPFVFSGVNGEPEDYNFTGRKNIAGVLQRYPFVHTMGFIKEIYPSAKKAVVISDSSSTGEITLEWMKKEQVNIPDFEFIDFIIVETFEEYKDRIKEYQNKTDIFVLRGTATFKDANGEAIPQEDVVKWTVQNSNIPEVSFWGYFVEQGALAAVEDPMFKEGQASAEIAKKILIDGDKPSKIPMKPLKEGEQFINLARAKTLGIEREDIPSIVLVNSQIIESFPWEANNSL
jgi:ABC-type uncharacterized transport system substrate-binding protein